MAPHCTKNLHHSLRNGSRVLGRNGSTRKPDFAQCLRGLVHRRARLRRYWNEAIVFKESNCLRSQFFRARMPQRHRRTRRIKRVLPAQSVETCSATSCNRARHWPDRAQNRERPHARRQMPPSRNPAWRWLQRADAREVRRHAHRPAAVATQSRGGHPRRNRRRLAPARSARRALEVPRIARAPMQQVRGLIGHQELRAVGGAQNQRSRRAQPRHHHRILAGTSPLCSRLPISHR